MLRTGGRESVPPRTMRWGLPRGRGYGPVLSDAVAVLACGAIHGLGLVAIRHIAAGECVWQGDPGAARVSCAQVVSWPASERGGFQAVGWQVDDESYEVCNDDSRYMNHSCDPNTWWNGEGVLVARRDVAPGEEVTYDYATSELALSPNIVCACGSAFCRGRITNHDYRDPAWQRRYEGHLPAHLRRAVKALARGEPGGAGEQASGKTGHATHTSC